jgi:hypothetical protein
MNNTMLGCLVEELAILRRAFWPNEPDGLIHRQVADRPNALGYASAKRTQRTMIFPQTKPTSANEANREIIVKTMFEHEQHESWLLGRTNRRYWAGHFGQTNPRSRPRQLFRQSEPKRPISQRFSQTNLRGRLRHGCALRRTLTRAGRGVLARIPLEPILSASCAGRAPRRQGRRGPR